MNAPDETPKEPGRLKRTGTAIVAKPRDAAKAVGGGFKWAGGGIATKTKQAGRKLAGGTKGARGAVAAKASPATGRVKGLWAQARERFQSNPWMGIAAICGGILLVAWIAWAIYVTSTNGANAGLGVVISWPAVLMAIALVMAPFVGAYLLIKRLQGDESTDPPIAGGAPDETEDSSATAGTNPG